MDKCDRQPGPSGPPIWFHVGGKAGWRGAILYEAGGELQCKKRVGDLSFVGASGACGGGRGEGGG